MRVEEMHFIEMEAEYHLDASKGVKMLRDFMHDYRDASYNRIQVGADFAAFKKELLLQKRIICLRELRCFFIHPTIKSWILWILHFCLRDES